MGTKTGTMTALQAQRMNELVKKVAGKKLTAELYEQIRLWENSDGYDGVELSPSLDAVCTEIETKWKTKTGTAIRLGSFEGCERQEDQDGEEIQVIGNSVLFWYFEQDEIYELKPAAKALKTKFGTFATVIAS